MGLQDRGGDGESLPDFPQLLFQLAGIKLLQDGRLIGQFGFLGSNCLLQFDVLFLQGSFP